MYRTPAYVAKVLGRVNRPIAPRTLLNWVEKGLLPHLNDRGQGRAKGKLYFWTERTIVHQALMVYDLLRWRSRADSVRFLLWLLGYPISVERYIRPQFLEAFNGVAAYSNSEVLAEGEVSNDWNSNPLVDTAHSHEVQEDGEAEEELLDRLSELAVKNSERWRHIPRKEPNRHVLTDPVVIEAYLNALMNPRYEPSTEGIIDLLNVLASGNTPNREGPPAVAPSSSDVDDQTRAEYIALAQRSLRFVARHLSLPALRGAIVRATADDWHDAQQDFQRVLHILIRIAQAQDNDVQQWGDMRFNMVHLLGMFFIPVNLALRTSGYATWIERGHQFIDLAEQYLDTGEWEQALVDGGWAVDNDERRSAE